MPVSKKRKKSGKPVKRTQPAPAGEEQAHLPGETASRPSLRQGKPTNPFVAMQTRRASQRGR